MVKYLYILKLQDDCYYVGITNDLKTRIVEHYAGEGAKWTKLHKPIEIVHTEKLPYVYQPYVYENIWTLKCMKKYGIINTRGGCWCQVVLSEISRVKILKMIDEDICFKCKIKGHHTDSCKYEYNKDFPVD